MKKWRPPSEAQLSLERDMSDALKTFIRQTRVQGKHVEPPDSDAQERLSARVAAWLALAHTHGTEQAQQDVARAISIGTPRNWFGKAKQVVASLVASITETVEGWMADATDGDVEVDEADIADMVTQELEAFAENKADLISTYEIPAAFENGMLETFVQMGYAQVVWVAQDNACPICVANSEQGAIPIGQGWNGLDGPPAHSHCRCNLDVADNLTERVAQPLQRISKMGACTCEVCTERNGKPVEHGKEPPYHEGGCDCTAEEVTI